MKASTEFKSATAWIKVRVGDALRLINGRAFKPSEWKEKGLPIVRIQNLNNPEAPFNHYEGDLPEKFLLNNGDLLFAWSGTPGTSFGAHIWRGGRAWLNQHIFKVIYDDTEFDKRFLRLAINKNLTEYILAAHGGAGLAHITKGKFEQSELLKPTLNEQQSIVAEIEKQFSRLDEAVANLKRVKANLKRYKAAFLKAALEGKLTEAWRKAHPDVEPASKLLERILLERRTEWKGRGKYKEPTAPKTSNLPSLPKTWTWVTVGEIITQDLCNGISVKGSNNPPGIRALRLSAMSDLGFDYSDIRYLPLAEDKVDDLWIQGGDFFISRGNGSLHLVGRGTSAQAPLEETIFPDTMIRLRLAKTIRKTGWVGTIWPSRTIRSQIEQKVKTTAGIYKISQPEVRQIMLPFPPIAEQEFIVAEVARHLSIIEGLHGTVEANLTRASRLRQSILGQAFSGKLLMDGTCG